VLGFRAAAYEYQRTNEKGKTGNEILSTNEHR